MKILPGSLLLCCLVMLPMVAQAGEEDLLPPKQPAAVAAQKATTEASTAGVTGPVAVLPKDQAAQQSGLGAAQPATGLAAQPTAAQPASQPAAQPPKGGEIKQKEEEMPPLPAVTNKDLEKRNFELRSQMEELLNGKKGNLQAMKQQMVDLLKATHANSKTLTETKAAAEGARVSAEAAKASSDGAKVSAEAAKVAADGAKASSDATKATVDGMTVKFDGITASLDGLKKAVENGGVSGWFTAAMITLALAVVYMARAITKKDVVGCGGASKMDMAHIMKGHHDEVMKAINGITVAAGLGSIPVAPATPAPLSLVTLEFDIAGKHVKFTPKIVANMYEGLNLMGIATDATQKCLYDNEADLKLATEELLLRHLCSQLKGKDNRLQRDAISDAEDEGLLSIV